MAVCPALHTALSSLLAQQVGLNTVGHNIANANTPGYSRQRAILQPATANHYTYGAIGQGVVIDSVERIVDEFINSQIRDADNQAQSGEIRQAAYNRLEALFDELSGNDLSTATDRFFQSMHDLSATIEDQPTRDLVVQEGESLRELVNTLYAAMTDYRTTLDNNVLVEVDKVNNLLDEIAKLNVQIGINEGTTGAPENDLRDVRDSKLRELAGIMDITAIEQPNKSVTVTTKGMPLVIFERTYHLTTRLSTAENMPIHEVVFEDGGGKLLTTSGSLPASMEARDQIVKGFMDDLDQFAASLIFEFNRIHSQGVGTDALTSVVSENVPLDADVPLDQMNLGFTPMSGTFTVKNGSLTIDIVNAATGETLKYRVPIDLDGVGADTTLNGLAAAINAAVPAGTITASVDTLNHLHIDSDDPAAYGFFFSEDTSGVLATLGINNFFTGHSAGSMGISDTLTASGRFLATGKTLNSGDSDNLLALLDLRDQPVLDGNSKSLEEFYRSMIGRMATESATNTTRLQVNNDVLVRLENERENMSGVSLDEEMTRMIEYQRAYQASARFMAVLDTVLDSLINRT